MTRFETKIKLNIDQKRVKDVRREWQSWADSEDLWALELCTECSRLRRELRSVSVLLCAHEMRLATGFPAVHMKCD
jgi:hypothetical protein